MSPRARIGSPFDLVTLQYVVVQQYTAIDPFLIRNGLAAS